jgi:salicylate hydroxylase
MAVSRSVQQGIPPLIKRLNIPYHSVGGRLFLHRAKLLDVLVDHLPSDYVHFNKRLISFPNDTEGVTLHFADGMKAITDILVGCDGIKSFVRRQMYTETASETGASIEEYLDKYIEPAWTGTRAYRTLIPVEQLEKVNPEHSCLKAPMVVSLSLRLGEGG